MPTKRRRIRPRLKRPAWVDQVLEEHRPPFSWADFNEYVAWRDEGAAVPGLPDARSPEGAALLATVRTSLR